MKTHKEKAKELVKPFMKIGMIGFELKARQQKAKKCALICVDEILDMIMHSAHHTKAEEDFWQELKQEIEKL